MKQYIVDAFTNKPFAGNPAAVCVMEAWPGEESMMQLAMDCVSRSFCPKVQVPEDPVCGSAHCQIAAYWADVLHKPVIEAYQASKRGGYLHCEMDGNGRIRISGEAVLVAESDLKVQL